jgi:site-specific DNA recombinase
MNRYYGYIRVSTAKQGVQGVSLPEQKDAILRYCQRNGMAVCQWFEERETAAKAGRPVFSRMLRLLAQGKARGVVIHKIDRSARNLKDWANLGELIDRDIEVHFANESLDLKSRGGRLSADIQAVVAAGAAGQSGQPHRSVLPVGTPGAGLDGLRRPRRARTPVPAVLLAGAPRLRPG